LKSFGSSPFPLHGLRGMNDAQSNPVLVDVTRGGQVESRHRGAIAVADAEGRPVFALGNISRPIFPRSAIKLLQAIPLVESGGADIFGLDVAELAVACASHSGEPKHVEAVRSLLAKAGVDETLLACGPHWPIDERAARELARQDSDPCPIHNNCSGKHAGMLAAVRHLGLTLRHYERPDHPLQLRIRETVADITGAPLVGEAPGVDGCSVPTWPLPLQALATGFARIATGALAPTRASAAQRLMQACITAPDMVAGRGRLDTVLMQAFAPQLLAKGGAEGVHCAAILSSGFGIAIKMDDGAKRGAEAVLVHLLAHLTDGAGLHLQPILQGGVRNWRGDIVGRVQPAPPFSEALRALPASPAHAKVGFA
jgi:L-asparaginase II